VPNVLIRDVPSDDLEQIRRAAADRGMSVQAFLRDAVHVQAAHLRRRAALDRVGERLRGQGSVSPDDRSAVLDAIDSAHDDRAAQLSDPSR
jgi:hypothetical protein